MKKIDLGVSIDEVKNLFTILYEQGRLSESEYKKALEKASAGQLNNSGFAALVSQFPIG